jgi:hypothetical protein
MRNIIYEDENIKCIYVKKDGSNKPLIITFSDAVHLDSPQNEFYGDSIFIENEFNCIGIVAKNPNWFPAKSIESFCIENQGLLNAFDEKIGYGSSMGAYGCIKYSKLLGLQLSLAMAPQWSINKNECNYPPGFQEYFKDGMGKMGIDGNEVSGRIFLFYDPHSTIDTNHANKIKSLNDQVYLIKVPYSGHTPARTLRGSDNLLSLMNHANSHDIDSINKIVGVSKKNNSARNYHLFNRAIVGKPKFAAAILLGRVDQDPIFRDIFNKNYHRIVGALSSKPELHGLLKQCIEKKSIMEIDLKQKIVNDLLLGKGRLRYIQTHTKKFLFFNLIDGKISQSFFGETPFQVPVLSYVLGEKIKLFIYHYESPVYFCVDEKTGSLELSFSGGDNINFDISYINDQYFAISNDQKYLSVGGQSIKFGPQKAHNWERFMFEEEANAKLWR